MSDVSQGPGWWQASDGKWYPPADTDQPGPGWWLASDGNWYPPERRTTPAEADPSVRTPVKPVAKPAARSGATDATSPPPRPAPDRPTAAMGTPAGPAVAPTRAPTDAGRGATARPPETGRRPTPSPSADASGSGRATTASSPPAGTKAPRTTAAPTKPAATAPTGSKATTATPGAKAKPAATATAATTKPAAAAPKGPHAAPIASPAGPRAGAGPVPPGAADLSPDAQIRARNEQSRRDAAVLFGARKSAATRALGNISALIEQEKAAPAARPEPAAAPRAGADAPAPPATPPRPTSPPAPKTRGKLGRVARTPDDPAPGPAAVADVAPPAAAPDPTPPSTDPPLLEVKQGTLAADIEHIGERLVIFNDRVELHDRNDRVRQVIAGADIADVVVHKKFTGSTVTVEAGTGERIVAKGLKPEQADEIRSVILKRTRSGTPSGAAPRSDPRTSRAEPREPIVDAREREPGADDRREELLAKLDDLHRAGVLTDAELADKQALVERLLDGDTLAVSSPSA